MLKKSVFEKFVQEMKAKFKDEYILILATDISGEWELQQVEAYSGTYGLTLGSHRVDTLDDNFFTFVNNHINEFEKPHNVIARKYNLPDEVTDYILYMVEQLDSMQNELEEAKEEIESLNNSLEAEWKLRESSYDDDYYYDDDDYEDDYYDYEDNNDGDYGYAYEYKD